MTISIIIPALNEEQNLPRLLPLLSADGTQVLVADGGSTDATIAVAEKFSARVIRAPRGRGVQMNAGAAATSGEILWFLHADTIPPPDWKEQILRGMAEPQAVGGGFRVTIDSPGIGYRFLDAWGWLRTGCERTLYGDQGIFVRRTVFESLGGFSHSSPVEDLDFSTRLRRCGKVILLPNPLTTSARRWQEDGFWPTVAKQTRMILSYRRPIPIVIMAKAPIQGLVKTRLVPPLTQAQAAELAADLLTGTAALVREIQGAEAVIAVEPAEAMEMMRQLIEGPIRLVPQGEGEFGVRLLEALRHGLAGDAKGAILLGADHPHLPAEYLEQAVKILQEGGDRVVLGPTQDGGYYLIGLNRPHPELFEGIPWSTSQVLSATLDRAKRARLSVTQLPPWHDIDRPEDLIRLRGGMSFGTISAGKGSPHHHGKSE